MTGEGLTILAVDDERTQLEDLARMLRNSPLVDEVECASDVHQALKSAGEQSYDAIFLDVRMPELDGIALGRVLRRFEHAPKLVFVSAYDAAAVDAFELDAVDYLRKPVSRRRLDEALGRVTEALERVADQGTPRFEGDVVALQHLTGAGTRLVSRGSILFVQAHGDYLRVITDDGRFVLRVSAADLAERWEPYGFARVHRQYVANLHRAVELRPLLDGGSVLVFGDGTAIPVARRHVAELRRRLRV
jgi:DNA-binding LytR/AlgR family response regulator